MSGTSRRAKPRVSIRSAKPEQSLSKLGVAAPHRQSGVVQQHSVQEEAQSLTPLVSLPYYRNVYTFIALWWCSIRFCCSVVLSLHDG
jgi:hypothetical protein